MKHRIRYSMGDCKLACSYISLYSYIRPILEYCTPVWLPYLLCDFKKIEAVQKYFTRRLFPGKQLTYCGRLSRLQTWTHWSPEESDLTLSSTTKLLINLWTWIHPSFSIPHIILSFNTRYQAFKLSTIKIMIIKFELSKL